MQRHPLLQPLSREHHTALTLAQACERAARSGDDATVSTSCQRAVQACLGELHAHFLVEEQTLLPLLNGTAAQPLAQRTASEHQELLAMLDGLRQNDAATLGRFGQHLSAHVRFEERELFPQLELSLTSRGR